MLRILSWIGIVIVSLFIIVLILPFVIPANKFRPIIEQKTSAALGRNVQVGNLRLSLLTGALAVDNVSISDDPKFSSSPFLTAKRLNIGVEMRPLVFERQVNIRSISIMEPQVVLLKDQSGKWNFSSIGPASKNQSPAPKSQQSAQQEASQTPPTHPANENESLSIEKLELRDGQITLGNANSQKRAVYPDVNLTATSVSTKGSFPVEFSMALPGGGKMEMNGKAGPVDENDSALTPENLKLAVHDLNLAIAGVLDPSLGLGGLLNVQADVQSSNGQSGVKGQATLSQAKLVAGGSPSPVPTTVDFDTKYDIPKGSGVLNPSTLKIGSATAKLDGNYKSEGDQLSVDMKVNGQNMPAKDLEGFLPALAVNIPHGANLTAGTLNTDLHITGPTNKFVTEGNVGLFSATLAGFDLSSRMASVSALAGLPSTKDLQIEKMTTNLHETPNGLKADGFNAVLPALGTLDGGGSVNEKNQMDFNMVATLSSDASKGKPISNLTSGILNCKNGGTKVPFRIEGTTSDPKFLPDVSGIAVNALKSQLNCSGGIANGLGQGQNTQGQNPTDVINKVGGLFGKKKKP